MHWRKGSRSEGFHSVFLGLVKPLHATGLGTTYPGEHPGK